MNEELKFYLYTLLILKIYFCFFVDGCSPIKSVQLPVAHNTRQLTQGAWMKDPLGLMGRETIFVMEFYYSKKEVEEFENMEAFKAGIVHKTHTLPYNYDGTGAVVYGPFLYYNRCVLIFEAGPSFSKHDLRNTRVTSLSTYGE